MAFKLRLRDYVKCDNILYNVPVLVGDMVYVLQMQAVFGGDTICSVIDLREEQIVQAFELSIGCGEGFTVTLEGDCLYIVGGCIEPAFVFDPPYHNTGYVYDLVLAESRQLDPRSDCRLAYHSCDLVGDSLVIFGGKEENGSLSTIAYVMDLVTAKFVKLTTKGSPPSARCNHASLAAFQTLFIYGGHDKDNEWCSDLFCLNGARWSEVRLRFRAAPPIWYPCMVLSRFRNGVMFLSQEFSSLTAFEIEVNKKSLDCEANQLATIGGRGNPQSHQCLLRLSDGTKDKHGNVIDFLLFGGQVVNTHHVQAVVYSTT